ncbi:hypothetical protein TNCV_4952151 [Trichonephila clavipes]|nr:hypothetical protein TNCV_4952151 [Trichonephila clavipes]
MARKRAENREGSLGVPRVREAVFTKDSKPLGRRKKITRAPREREPHSPKEGEPLRVGSVKPVLSPKEGEPPEGFASSELWCLP